MNIREHYPMRETFVKLEAVSKKFCRNLRRSLWHGVQDLGKELFGRRHVGNGCLRPEEFWAIKDVSFELKRGECLGLIGRNGAGKTTLLRMLNGLIKPDEGRIEIRGRVGALIALGAGFNPVLTGRENVHVNASILGLSRREIDMKIEEIIDFAEIGEFIDAPVQSYSSGMAVRLGFAVASSISTEVLLLDEVLAVGDSGFREKCYGKIAEIKRNAATIIVSHHMPHINQICDRVIVLDNGQVVHSGNVDEGIRLYEGSDNCCISSSKYGFKNVHSPITNFEVTLSSNMIHYADRLILTLTITSIATVENVLMRAVFTSIHDDLIAEYNSDALNENIYINNGDTVITVEIDSLHLKSGYYHINFMLYDDTRLKYLVHCYKVYGIEVVGTISVPSFLLLGSIEK